MVKKKTFAAIFMGCLLFAFQMHVFAADFSIHNVSVKGKDLRLTVYSEVPQKSIKSKIKVFLDGERIPGRKIHVSAFKGGTAYVILLKSITNSEAMKQSLKDLIAGMNEKDTVCILTENSSVGHEAFMDKNAAVEEANKRLEENAVLAGTEGNSESEDVKKALDQLNSVNNTVPGCIILVSDAEPIKISFTPSFFIARLPVENSIHEAFRLSIPVFKTGHVKTFPMAEIRKKLERFCSISISVKNPQNLVGEQTHQLEVEGLGDEVVVGDVGLSGEFFKQMEGIGGKSASSDEGGVKWVSSLILLAVLLLAVLIILYLLLRKRGSGNKAMDGSTTSMEPSEQSAGPCYFAESGQHIGTRDEQQDSFGISDIRKEGLVREKGVLAVVADGMGGMEQGKAASRTVVEAMMSFYQRMDFSGEIAEKLHEMALEANSAVHGMSAEKGRKIKTGSTAAAALLKKEKLYWVSVGDSRIYIYRKGRLLQLTRDHNYGNQLDENAANGFITQEEARNHPDRHALTSYFGIAKLTQVDRNIRPLLMNPGEKVMLCSDGIYKTLEEREMEEILKLKTGNHAEELIRTALAKSKPHQDNMTVVIMGYQ